jgi:hypothetical protein
VGFLGGLVGFGCVQLWGGVAHWQTCPTCGGALAPPRSPSDPPLPLPPPPPPARWVFSQLHKKGLVYRGFKVRSDLALGLGV